MTHIATGAERFTRTTPWELRQMLNKGVVIFTFKKKDGTLRRAVGTSNIAVIPGACVPRTGKRAADSVVPFYDLEMRAWRSLSVRVEVFAL